MKIQKHPYIFINQVAGESTNLTFGGGEYGVSIEKHVEEIEKF